MLPYIAAPWILWVLNWHLNLTSWHRPIPGIEVTTSEEQLVLPGAMLRALCLWCFLWPAATTRPGRSGEITGETLCVFSCLKFFFKIVQICADKVKQNMEHVQKSFKSFWSLCPSVTCQVHSFKCDVRWGHHVGVAFFQLWIPCPACLWRRDLTWCQPVGHGAEKKNILPRHDRCLAEWKRGGQNEIF